MKITGLNEKYIQNVELTKQHLGMKFDGEIEFRESDCLRVYKEGEKVVVEYSELCEVFRGLSMTDRVVNENTKIEQKARISLRGTYADCCRNAVMTIDALKELIVTAATMGLNFIYMYMEDSFPLPECPYFGHKRGGYSKEDLIELESFAKDFGILLGASIQTLGHLQVIKDWHCFKGMFGIWYLMRFSGLFPKLAKKSLD